jgi:2-dehydropantoate 2-reductase
VRYVVLGAGAVGGTIGGRLAESGCDVALVGRGEHARTVKRDGLRLAMPDRIARLRIPMLTTDELRLTSDDVLIVTVKSQDTQPLLDQVLGVPFDGPGDRSEIPVLCAQNGIANEHIALRFFGRVYGACVNLPATHLEPGLVEAEGIPLSGVLQLGRYPAGTDELITSVAADLERSAFGADVQPDVMAWKRAKLISNLGNALEVLCKRDGAAGAAGGTGGRPAGLADARGTGGRPPGLTAVTSALAAEAMTCFASAGWPVTDREIYRSALAGRFKSAPIEGRSRQGGSTWQSVERGLPSVETDFLNGEIVRLGRLHGIPTPVNVTIQARMRAVVEGALRPRTLDPAQLLS